MAAETDISPMQRAPVVGRALVAPAQPHTAPPPQPPAPVPRQAAPARAAAPDVVKARKERRHEQAVAHGGIMHPEHVMSWEPSAYEQQMSVPDPSYRDRPSRSQPITPAPPLQFGQGRRSDPATPAMPPASPRPPGQQRHSPLSGPLDLPETAVPPQPSARRQPQPPAPGSGTAPSPRPGPRHLASPPIPAASPTAPATPAPPPDAAPTRLSPRPGAPTSPGSYRKQTPPNTGFPQSQRGISTGSVAPAPVQRVRRDTSKRLGVAVARRPSDALPLPESAQRLRRIHGAAIACLSVMALYVLWRIGFTIPTQHRLFAIVFLLLEIQAILGTVMYVAATWNIDPPPAPSPPAPQNFPSVTVLITTYNEDMEVLLPTVTAAIDMVGPHETWVLDDGNRKAVADMASSLGARYLTRPTLWHAKAGNLNSALKKVRSELVAVFDADHVPDPDFLTRCVGYFQDRKVALVQTPQDFYNTNSFEHVTALVHEESLFYRVIQPGKNKTQGAFWCGTNAMLRTSALRSVGGVATETVTEDLHTTIKLHQGGWKTIYHNEVLARGLAAFGPQQFYAQRLRWGRGAMQIIRKENPAFARNLSWQQRLSYFYTLSAWFDSWRTLLLACVPAVVLLTGITPIQAPVLGMFVVGLLSLGLQQYAFIALSRGRAKLVGSLVFEIIRLPAHLIATTSLFTKKALRFSVTLKGRTGTTRERAQAPALLVGLLVLQLIALAWGALSVNGLTPVKYSTVWVQVVCGTWAVYTVAVTTAAIRRIRMVQFGVERREGHRFPVDFEATLDGAPATVVDVSTGGARVVCHGGQRPLRGQRMRLTVTSPADVASVTLYGKLAGRQGQDYRLRFEPHQWPALATLTSMAFTHTTSRRRG